MTLETALRDYLAQQLRVVEAEEAGIVQDTDPEPLHRFRVALRRSRAVLGEMQAEVVPKLAGLRRQMAAVMRRTNARRDADVFLALLPTWRGQVLDFLADGIEGLERPLRRQREEAHRQVLALLGSEEYRKLKNDWHAWLTAPPGAWLAAEQTEPPAEILQRHIARRRKKVKKRLRTLARDAAPEAVHRLRIAVKKLRYLLEFAAASGEIAGAKQAIARLKELQDWLGAHHDAAVQSAWLGRILTEAPRLSRHTAAVIGWLLAERQRCQARALRKLSRLSGRWGD
ncbi:hypothetical protein MIT9_P1186 [Methylomarinovum caldicuralii]|uniref:CHAD domain-containing protein n=1 Tax=Methylomarinovum caldicuralii TaxID=438856 RepID=A0AAU9CNS7_9GAMM|nr:CHAD domain-containing protein [Methylomarinovum caldicuralii]BCX81608.1 hypothetical protein MIT9_P1186 [Methylomarinovum caldicuralii]